mmetsp:Transcript_26341/g.56844  ORF Transcript_26341/g.56844 Transcript_26341/m.56844 type:complete len:353 (-) Transcript_26341:690-1748(-)
MAGGGKRQARGGDGVKPSKNISSHGIRMRTPTCHASSHIANPTPTDIHTPHTSPEPPTRLPPKLKCALSLGALALHEDGAAEGEGSRGESREKLSEALGSRPLTPPPASRANSRLAYGLASFLGHVVASATLVSRPYLHDGLGDQDCVESSAAQQLVTADEEVEAFIAEDVVGTNPAHLDVILGGGGERHGVQIVGGVVDNNHAGGGLERGQGGGQVDWLLRLDGDGLGVSAQRGDAHAGAGDGHVWHVEDLARLPGDLALFLSVLVVEEFVNVRDHIEGQWVCEDLVLDLLTGGHGAHALLQLVHARSTRTRRRLVGGHDALLDGEELVERRERHQGDGRGAVRVGDEPHL